MILARGRSGEIRVGYQVAARLGRWALDWPDEVMGAQRWTLHAGVLETDPYWIAHGQRFDLLLHFGPRTWRWRDVQVSGNGAVVQGEGRPEE